MRLSREDGVPPLVLPREEAGRLSREEGAGGAGAAGAAEGAEAPEPPPGGAPEALPVPETLEAPAAPATPEAGGGGADGAARVGRRIDISRSVQSRSLSTPCRPFSLSTALARRRKVAPWRWSRRRQRGGERVARGGGRAARGDSDA